VRVYGYNGASGRFALRVATRLAILSDLVVDYKVSIEALQDGLSPQHAALDWMAYNDSADLQSTLSDDQLVERFVLVLLYFSTDGEGWKDQAGFLSSSLNTCAWNSIIDVLRIGVGGCNDEGSVVTLYFSKFPNSSSST
jgi:hypothetical protein